MAGISNEHYEALVAARAVWGGSGLSVSERAATIEALLRAWYPALRLSCYKGGGKAICRTRMGMAVAQFKQDIARFERAAAPKPAPKQTPPRDKETKATWL